MTRFNTLAVGLLVAALAVGAMALLLFRDAGEAAPHLERPRAVQAVETPNPDVALAAPPAAEPAPQPAAASATNPAPRPRLPTASPRELLEKARQSGSAEDALLAAQSIRSCQWRAGSGQMIREALAKKGTHMSPERMDALLKGIDLPERACQELDAGMLAQYEPLLQRAMKGGLKGAAAMWWSTPEAKALSTASAAANAHELLRRDAMACDKGSLGLYQALELRFRGEFDAVAAAAMEAAQEELVKQGKLKANSTLQEFKAFLPPNLLVRPAMDPEAVKARTAEILRACDAG